MSFRLAAYALCIEDDRILLVECPQHDGSLTWTLPGGGVEPAEDPFDAVTREVAEESGYEATVTTLLGVDSRIISAEESYAGVTHQNLGVYYEVQRHGGALRPEPDGVRPQWTPMTDVPQLRRSSLVDVGLALWRQRPATGHVPPIPTGGLLRH